MKIPDQQVLDLFESGKSYEEIAEELGKGYGQVKHAIYRARQGSEERKPTVEDKGKHYLITSGKRTITITKDKLRELKSLYCGESPLTINQVCRKLNIPRRDFHLIKTAFDITHDDVPYIDDDLTDDNLDDLVSDTLEKRKEKYFLKLQQEEIKELEREVKQYRKRDYFYDKVINEIVVPVAPLNFNIKRNILSDTEGLLNLADWHTGLKVESYWNSYSLDIQRERLQELIELTVAYIHRHNVKNMHVMNLGDMLHGIIHVSTRVVSEVDVIQQFRIAWQLIAEILKALAKEVEQVYFYSTYGNHSRITEKKTDALDRENFELLLPDMLKEHLQNIPNIIFMPNEYDDQILVAKPNGHLVFGVHGDRDKPEKVAGNLTMMMDMKPEIIFTAHSHHKLQLEVHKVDVIMSRSLCGVDDFAKDIRATSKPGQSFYVFNPDKLECVYDITFG